MLKTENRKLNTPSSFILHPSSFILAPALRLVWLKVIVAAALGCGFLLSPKLWVSTREFPLSPVADLLPAVAFPADYFWFAVLLALLASIAFSARPGKSILAFVVLAVSLSLFDQTRWQPWFYQYVFMLATLAFCSWQQPSTERDRAALDACRFIVASIYVWSGLQKMNAGFVWEVWPALLSPFLRFAPEALRGALGYSGLVVPLVEVCTGLGLFTRRLRNPAVAVALAAHLSVLVLFVPLGRNSVVWPWNIAMMLFVVVLFWRDEATAPKQMLLNRGFAFHRLLLILFGFMPALSFFQLWDSYLSSALYSGNTTRTVIAVGDSNAERLSPTARRYVRRNAAGQEYLDINRWAYGELNVPAYPARRVSRKIARQVCARAGHPSGMRLVVKSEPGIFDRLRQTEYYDCSRL